MKKIYKVSVNLIDGTTDVIELDILFNHVDHMKVRTKGSRSFIKLNHEIIESIYIYEDNSISDTCAYVYTRNENFKDISNQLKDVLLKHLNKLENSMNVAKENLKRR